MRVTGYGPGNVREDHGETGPKKQSRKLLALGIGFLLVAGLVAAEVVRRSKLPLKSHLALASQEDVEPPIPGTDALSRGYNLFIGEYFSVQSSRNIGDFVYPSSASHGNTILLGSNVYVRVDALTVTADYKCEKIGLTTSAAKTLSVSDMKAEGNSQSYGYDQTTTVSASVPVGPGEVGASTDYRTALLFGNSNEMVESSSYSERNFNYRSGIEYNARAFDARVRWDATVFSFSSNFVAAFNAVGSYSSTGDRNKKAYQFFNQYGSHVVKDAIFGAKCSKSVYYNAGNTASSSSRVEKTIKNNEISIFNLQFGSSSSTTTSTATDSSTAVTYEQTGEKCDGIVQNNGCNHAQDAVSLQPTILQANGLAVWTLNVPQLSSSAKQAFQASVDYLVGKTRECSQRRCNQQGGSGVCVLKKSFWSTVSSSTYGGTVDDSSFESSCVCSTGERPNCRPVPPVETLQYGVVYHVQNKYGSWGGGYLDTRAAGCEGNWLCVSTSWSKDRSGEHTASWKLTSPTGASGDVKNGDVVVFECVYGGAKLDTRGAGCEGNKYCVSAGHDANRLGEKTGWWKIIADDSTEKFIRPNIPVKIRSEYGHSWLDTRGAGCEGNAYCVSTSASEYRNNEGTTTWRFVK